MGEPATGTRKRTKPQHPPFKEILHECLEPEGRAGMSLASIKKFCSETYGEQLPGTWESNLKRELKKLQDQGEIKTHYQHKGHFVLLKHHTPEAKETTKKAAPKKKAAAGGKKKAEEEEVEMEEEEEEEEAGAEEEEEEEEAAPKRKKAAAKKGGAKKGGASKKKK